jgi:hypothetical protein
MASKATNARRRTWERAFNKYVDLNLSLEQAQKPEAIEKLGEALAKQQDELMELNAPTLTAVLQKLYILWGETDLHGLDRESEEKRVILEDLEELIADTAYLLGATPEQHPVRTLGLWPTLATQPSEQQA